MKAIPPAFQYLLVGIILTLKLHAQANVLTYHNDLSRSGLNPSETILTPSNVNDLQFGQLFKYPVDGDVYAQPLYMSGVTISGTVHNVIFICTAHDSVYAFDADSNAGASGGLLWHVSLGTSAATPNNTFGNRYGAYGDIVPEVGIIGTPVIDPATNTLYVDAFTNDSGTTYYHRIHALSIFNGSEQLGGPLLVQATYPGGGVASSGGVLSFSNEYSNQRQALTFVNGKLIVAYAAFLIPIHTTAGFYHSIQAPRFLSRKYGLPHPIAPPRNMAVMPARAGSGRVAAGSPWIRTIITVSL